MANDAGGVRVESENMRSIIAANVLVGYSAIGTGLLYPSRAVKFDNFTNQTLTFSDDGVNDKFQLMADSSFIFYYCSNKTNQSGVYCYAAGTVFYVKQAGVAPTLGQVNVTSWFAQNP